MGISMGKSLNSIKWPKITFRGSIWVPKVSFWGFWGWFCLLKCSQNFDSGTRSAIFGTPKMGHFGHFGHFGGTKNGTSGARIKILRPLL